MNEIELYELEQLANEAKMRGVKYLGITAIDWRDIPTSNEELENMSIKDREYWKSVAVQLATR